MTVTPEDVNRWQSAGVFHSLTCRSCRGWGDCQRRDVGNVGGDHHVMRAVEFMDGLGLICECCGETQDFPDELVADVEFHRNHQETR